ncbi:hypothetical protein CEUSTIGMA_g6553.t1 [Chlamydomonas eustigma]|uniref:Uncharacterized protein n=1 Tax=Chlamydomonas eustigma TaxID=1157962 RepID=A0A250X7Q7_9CHLO|nr:hypothetical protein CEUSTIGMA_g6553.t1 [Chlamydomonas eustigma]|eukprot:GAX79113.1 hypothetical protein CEUSTIGMA_g6553.t1 [Chlamydomonas eustigma]
MSIPRSLFERTCIRRHAKLMGNSEGWKIQYKTTKFHAFVDTKDNWLMLPRSQRISRTLLSFIISISFGHNALFSLPCHAFEQIDKTHHLLSEELEGIGAKGLTMGLGVSQDQALDILIRAPELRHISASMLKSRFDTLTSLMTSSTAALPAHHNDLLNKVTASSSDRTINVNKETVELVLKQPKLLTASSQDLYVRFKALAVLLKIPQTKVPELVQRQPGLATHSPATMSARLHGLQGLLQLKEVEKIVVSEPGLLTFQHEELAQRFQGFNSAFGWR